MVPAHDDLAVALHGNFGQPAVFAIPSCHHIQLIYIDALGFGITGKDIVDAERGIAEKGIELLSITR